MKTFLGEYEDEYEDIANEEFKGSTISKLYRAYNKIFKKQCCLEVISKEKLKIQDYDFQLERLNKEQEIQGLCNSTNTVNFYRRLETEKYIIFELEYCDDNLYNYLQENGELCKQINFFKEIVVSIAKALKILHEKRNNA